MRWASIGLLVSASLSAAGSMALAQESASYRLEEAVFNAGGHPADGDVPTSASYRITLDSMGEGVVRAGLASSSFHVDASFAGAYPPPGQVSGLSFGDSATLRWVPEKSAGSYNLYRDLLSVLSAGGYGECRQNDLPAATATATEPGTPPAGSGWFYIVTAKNRLDEEGSKGTDSAGAERPNPHPCP